MSGEYNGQEWIHKSSACCTPWGDGCTAFWCPCIIYGRTQHRLKIDPDLKDYKKKNDACMSWFWMSCCSLQFIMQAQQREEVTKKYGLKGDGKNHIRAFCCINCDLLQQDKEVESRDAERKGLVSDQPKPVQGMAYGSDDNKEEEKKESVSS